MMTNIIKLSLLLASLLLIQACGGSSEYSVDQESEQGDGGAANPPPAPEPTPEPTPEEEVLTQKVSSDKTSFSAIQGDTIIVPVLYQVLPEPTLLAGLGIRVHWDSSKISLDQIEQNFEQALLAVSEEQVDEADHDQDPNTDKFIVLSWASYPTGKWPQDITTWPLSLSSINFTATTVGGSNINFSASAIASGYQFEPQNIAVTIN